MAYIRMRSLAKTDIEFGTGTVSFIRGTLQSKDFSIPYTNGSGQQLTAGEVLFETGTNGTNGYMQIRSKNTVALIGNGVVDLIFTNQPSATVADGPISFTYDGSEVIINVDYNSRPVNTDLIIEVPYGQIHVFTVQEFLDHFSDFDNDTLDKVSIIGDVSNYFLSNVPYVAGTWVSKNEIANSLLEYRPNFGGVYTEQDSKYKVMDSNGNESE